VIRQLSRLIYLFFLLSNIQNNSYAQTGTWTELTNAAPDYNQGVMLLLTDGTVICHNSSGSGFGTGWDKLTPDAHGSYINGTWSEIANMNNGRLYFSSQVLPSGQVYVAGGEYGPGGGYGEVYDPVANTWTPCGAMPSGDNVYDGNSEILYNGTVLQGVVIPTPSIENLFYTPSTNLYTSAPNSLYSHDESAWLKLPDSSILFIGISSTNTNRYIPKYNKWVKDASVPVQIYDTYGDESGAAFMLPNGKAIFLGATQYNAIYTPSGDTTPGTWTAAADFPTISGSPTGQTDASAAMMVNGKILCAVSPIGISSSDEYRNPTYFVEYDYTTNTFTQVTSIIPDIGADSISYISSFQTNMLDLPDGNVLLSFDQAYNSDDYWIYTPGSAAIAAGKPTIDSIIPDVCPNYKLTGKLFNGISEGACYGDDWQMETNYPIVRLTNGTNVYYAKTTLWNRIGAVQTDSLEDTTVFTPPISLPAGTYSLVVVANGFASNPVLFTTPEVSITPASDTVCSGTPVNLTASGVSTYTWSPSTDLNFTTGATVTSTPTATTTYTVTGINSAGCAATAAIVVTVNPIPLITVPTPAAICSGSGSVTLTASGATTYTWMPPISLSTTSGATVTANPTATITYTVTGTIHGCVGTTTVIVTVNPTPTITATPSPAAYCIGGNSTLTASGGITYKWSPSTDLSETTGVTVSTNPTTTTTYTVTGTNSSGCSAKNTVAVTVNPNPTITATPSPASYCPGGNSTLTASGGSTYSWLPLTGLTVTTGAIVSANPTATTTYTVKGINLSGCSATDTVTITVNSNSILTISAVPDTICAGDTLLLTASGGKTYTWAPSTGLIATTGGTVNASPTATTTYIVTGINSNGCAAKDTITVTIKPAPDKPTITQNGNVLTSSATQGNQWMRNDTVLTGATNETDTITIAGYYQVIVKNPVNGCSTITDAIYITPSGINQLSSINYEVSVYPNPTTGEINVNISSSVGDIRDWSLQITDVLGRTVYTTLPPNPLKGTFEIDLSNLSNGVYFITVINKTGRAVVPVVKQN
jgi:hypothetical protein